MSSKRRIDQLKSTRAVAVQACKKRESETSLVPNVHVLSKLKMTSSIRVLLGDGYYVTAVTICSADKYPNGSHQTSTTGIRNGHPLIPTSDTPNIY